MKNNLSELNNYLFEELERLNDDEELQDETKLEKELKRSKAITNVAQTIINNANLVLGVRKYADEYGLKYNEMPQLLLGTKKDD